MDELLKMSTCSTDKPYQLRYLYDKLNVNIRGLEALGVKSTQYGSLLIPIIMAKLPPEIRVHVARNTSEDVWDIESILSLIQNEIEAREISEKIKAMTNITEPKRPQFPKQTTNSSFVVGSTTPLPTPACVYCSEMHFSASCQKITDLNVRMTILKRDKRCFTCLKKGLNAEQCDKSCRKCKRRHHQSICPEKTINSPVTQLSHLTTNQESKARGTTKFLALQRQPPLRRMQTRNTEYCYKQPRRSQQMKKEQNQLQSDYYSTMAVNAHTSQIAYNPGCN